MPVMPALTLVAALIASLVLVGLVRSYALRCEVLDHPGERSSHSTPTPRGAGAGLLTAWLLVIVPSLVRGWPGSWPLLAALAGVIAVAVFGWIDDHGGLAVRLRLMAHAAAACTLLPLVLLPFPVPAWPLLGAAVWWIFCGVASANVVNFMDGIDGLIGITALVYGGFAAAAGMPGGAAAECGLALAGAAAGFLAWNWSPARIFLGDVGSAAIGFVLVIIGVLLMRETGRGVILTFLPLWPIVLDASATLVRRWRRGEPLTQAHRSHLYQRLANGGWGHARVSLLFGSFALAGAACALLPPDDGRTVAAVTYLLATVGAGLALERVVPDTGRKAVSVRTPSP